jgi:hypothetical protein
MKKSFVLCIVMLAIPALAQLPTSSVVADKSEAAALWHQQDLAQNSPKTDATQTCSYTFTSGSGVSYLQYCVTANGNITQLQSPQGVEYINVGNIGEGYGFCDESIWKGYYDYAYTDSGNWAPAEILIQSAKTVRIARYTLDANWLLTQTITQDPTTPGIKITTALKNISGSDRYAAFIRWADVDANSHVINDLDGTLGGSVIGNEETAYGLMLQNIGSTNSFYVEGRPSNTPAGPDPCNLSAVKGGPLLNTDGSLVLMYDNFISNGETATGISEYKPY